MFTGLYAKLIASAIVLAVISGGYLYVKSIMNANARLNRENATLSQSNDELKQTLEAEKKMNDILQKVSEAGDKQRAKNKEVQQHQLQHIDEGVKQGKDKPVGEILKDFFNEE